MRKTPMKIAVGAAGLLLAGGAVAAAVDAPEAADKGLSTAEEHTGFAVPVGNDGDHPTKDNHPGNPGTDAADVAPDDQAPEADAAPTSDTHGAEVSAIARDDSTSGREHGEAVSEAARGDHGGAGAPEDEADVPGPNAGGTDTADEASGGASQAGTDKAADNAELGSGNAGDHGRP
jgi:hypothetical protein